MSKTTFILKFLIVYFILTSCSNDDSTPVPEENYFLNIEVLNTNLSSDNVPFYYSTVDECGTNKSLRQSLIGEINASQFSIQSFLVHYENISNFSDDNNQNSNVILPEQFATCFDNFDFFMFLAINAYGGNLPLDTSSNNTNDITEITFIREFEWTSQDILRREINYAISGNFNLTFLDINDTPVVVTGEYRMPVFVVN
jgi:hypothetical protein